MKSANFGIVFHGPGLESNSMDIRDLAPALLALNDLLQDADEVLNRKNCSSYVRIDANINEGSFDILLEVIQQVLDAGLQLGGIETWYDPVEVLRGIGFAISGGLNLLTLIKLLRGKKPEKIEDSRDGGAKIFIVGENSPVIVDAKTYALFLDNGVKNNLRKFISTIKSDDLNKISIKSNGSIVDVIRKDDVKHFESKALFDSREEATKGHGFFKLASAPAAENLKWRFIDGKRTISAAMEDGDFIEKWKEREELFGYGDMFELDIREIKKRTRSGFVTNYVIDKVYQHIPGDEQLEIDSLSAG